MQKIKERTTRGTLNKTQPIESNERPAEEDVHIIEMAGCSRTKTVCFRYDKALPLEEEDVYPVFPRHFRRPKK